MSFVSPDGREIQFSRLHDQLIETRLYENTHIYNKQMCMHIQTVTFTAPVRGHPAAEIGFAAGFFSGSNRQVGCFSEMICSEVAAFSLGWNELCSNGRILPPTPPPHRLGSGFKRTLEFTNGVTFKPVSRMAKFRKTVPKPSEIHETIFLKAITIATSERKNALIESPDVQIRWNNQ